MVFELHLTKLTDDFIFLTIPSMLTTMLYRAIDLDDWVCLKYNINWRNHFRDGKIMLQILNYLFIWVTQCSLRPRDKSLGRNAEFIFMSTYPQVKLQIKFYVKYFKTTFRETSQYLHTCMQHQHTSLLFLPNFIKSILFYHLIICLE